MHVDNASLLVAKVVVLLENHRHHRLPILADEKTKKVERQRSNLVGKKRLNDCFLLVVRDDRALEEPRQLPVVVEARSQQLDVRVHVLDRAVVIGFLVEGGGVAASDRALTHERKGG